MKIKYLILICSFFALFSFVSAESIFGIGETDSFQTNSKEKKDNSSKEKQKNNNTSQRNKAKLNQDNSKNNPKNLNKTKKTKVDYSDLKEPSLIEKDYLSRLKNLNIKIKQYGYEFFKGEIDVPTDIPVNEDYVIGPGDELIIYFITPIEDIDQTETFKVKVNREGQIYIPNIGLFDVWGLRLKEVKELIEDALGSNIKLTIGNVRNFTIYVSGEVRRPGAVIVNKFNSILDALILAGGVKKTGSLRNIYLTRKNGLRFKIDLYNLIIFGKPLDINLKDGDVILVNPIGKTAGIVGKVKRPAIYEIKGNERIKDLIKISGGLLPSGYKHKVILQRYENNTYLKVEEGRLDNKRFLNKKLKDGDIIIIKPIVNIPKNAIKITGYVTYPGVYQYKPNMTLSDILTPDMLFDDTNVKFGLIERTSSIGSPKEYITFVPEEILSGYKDIKLMRRDVITLYKFGDIKSVDFNKVKDAFAVQGEIKYPGVYAYKRGIKMSDILNHKTIKLNTNLDYAEIERRDPYTLDTKKIEVFSPKDILEGRKDIRIQRLDIIRFFPKYTQKPIKVSGSIKKAYKIPYIKGITLLQVLSKAEYKDDIQNLKVEIFRNEEYLEKLKKEQMKEEQDENSKEKDKKLKDKTISTDERIITIYLFDLLIRNQKYLDIELFPGDEVIIKKIKPNEVVKKVYIFGYVKKPGVYNLNKNKTLYDLIKEAGGFRDKAYPKGIVFLRKSVEEMQRQKLQVAINLMRQYLLKEEAGILQSELKGTELKAREKAFDTKKELLKELSKTQVTGRIAGLEIPKNIEKLKNSPFNLQLETEDKIYVPAIPHSVLVFGEVYNPSAYVYRKGLKVKDYISLSGGFTKFADRKNIFVIKANGTTLSSDSFDNKFVMWNPARKRFIWGFAYNKIMDYELEPGDAVIVPTEIHIPIMWRPLLKDVLQILYQSLLSVYIIKNL